MKSIQWPTAAVLIAAIIACAVCACFHEPIPAGLAGIFGSLVNAFMPALIGSAKDGAQ